MCKKLVFWASFVMVLSLAGAVRSDVIWTDDGPGHLWSTPTNWDSGTLPTSADRVRIRILPGPTISNEGTEVQVVWLGNGGVGALTVDGGTLTAETITIGQGGGSEGTLNMKSGTIILDKNLWLIGEGTGTLNMTGGTITVRIQVQVT